MYNIICIQIIVARMKVTGSQIEATQSHMNAMIAAYGCNMIALKMLHPTTFNPILEDFQPIENMDDTIEIVVERVVDEAIVRGEDETSPSNRISPMQKENSNICQVPNLIHPKSNEIETNDNEGRLVRRLQSNMAVGRRRQQEASCKSTFVLECIKNYTINEDDAKIADYVFNAIRDPL